MNKLRTNEIHQAFLSNRKQERILDADHLFSEPFYSNLLGSLERNTNRNQKMKKISYCQLFNRNKIKFSSHQILSKGKKVQKNEGTKQMVNDKESSKYRILQSMRLTSQKNNASIRKITQDLNKQSEYNLLCLQTPKILKGTSKALTMTIRAKPSKVYRKSQNLSCSQDYLTRSNLKWSSRENKFRRKYQSKITIFTQDNEKIEPWDNNFKQTIIQ